MFVKNFCLLIFLLLISIFCKAQTEIAKKKKDFSELNFNLVTGFIAQDHAWGELGVSYGRVGDFSRCGGSMLTSLFALTAECTFVNKDLLIAPKISYEFGAGIYVVKASLIRFEKTGIIDYRITPELGLNFQRIGLFFGWNIPLSNSRLDFISNTRFSLVSNF
jgi:hypothetical protein